MESHLESASSLHLDLARVKLDNTEVRLNITEAKLNDTEVRLSETQVKLYNTEKKLVILQRQFENKLVEDRENATVFVWKINNFNDKLRQAKTGKNKALESVPFYTKCHGYKLKVKFHPNGQKSGKNTHLSVYIAIMKGEYDAILDWPFKKKVRVTLIDQQEDPVERKNVFQTISLGDHPENGARPVNEENTGRGHTEFISHEKLFSRCYLKDDTLFLQVEVGP